MTWKPEAKLMLELEEGRGNNPLKEFQLMLIRNGIHKVYEVQSVK